MNMLKINIALLMALSLCLMPLAGSCENKAMEPDTGNPMSLKDAIAIAFSSNKDIQISEEEIQVAKANILQAQSEFLPKLNLDTSYTLNGAVAGTVPGFSQTGGKDQQIFTGYKNENQVGLSLTDSVYNGGANIANLRKARLELKSQEEALRFTKLSVEFEAKRLYYGLLLAYETERIMQNLYDQAEAHYEDVRNKFNQGTSSKFDVLQSKVQVSKVIPELVKARNAIDLIKADFNKLLGLNIYYPVVLKDNKLTYSLVEIKEEEFLKYAYQNNPDMIAKILGIDIHKWLIRVAESGWLPQVDFTANYFAKSDNIGNMVNPVHDNWNIGVSVTFPIFDGFSTKAKVDAAKARYAQAGLQKGNVEDSITVDIRKACLDMKESKSVIDSQKDSVEEAKEALKISNIAYDNGVGTNLDVLDSQVSLSQIEKNLSEGIYDYLMAKAFLHKTMGKEYFKEEDNEKKE